MIQHDLLSIKFRKIITKFLVQCKLNKLIVKKVGILVNCVNFIYYGIV